MKRLIIAGLICVLCLPGLNVFAQSESQTVSSLSQRYSFMVPGDWFVADAPGPFLDNTSSAFDMAQFQSSLPLDSITVADSEESVSAFAATDFEFSSPENFAGFDGGVVTSLLMPAGVADSVYALLGGEVDYILDQIEVPAGSSFELEKETLERAGLTGAEAQVSDGNVTFGWQFLLDGDENVLWVVWISDADHLSDVEDILASLNVRTFDLETLTDADALDLTVTIVPNMLEMDIPVGWWMLQSPETSMVMPALNMNFVERLGGNLQGEEGIILFSVQLDHSAFGVDAYDENGQLNPELVEDLYTSLFGQPPAEKLGYEIWSNGEGLAGLETEIDQTVEQGVIYHVLILDTEGPFTLVLSIADGGTWGQYEDVVRAILNSVRLIQE